MKLYTSPLTNFGAKTQIAVAEKNIDCEIIKVPFNMRDRYNPRDPNVARINPKLEVPVVIDGDLEIYDSTLISEYLEDICPSPNLWPTEAKARAHARLMELESDEVYFPIVQVAIRNATNPTAPEVAAARAEAQTYYDKLEELLKDRDYIAGDYTYADIGFIVGHYFAVLMGMNISEKHERLNAWRQRVAGRPAVSSVLNPVGEYLTSKGMKAPVFA